MFASQPPLSLKRCPVLNFSFKMEFPFARVEDSAAMAIVQFRPNKKQNQTFSVGQKRGMAQFGQEKGQREIRLSLYSSWHQEIGLIKGELGSLELQGLA